MMIKRLTAVLLSLLMLTSLAAPAAFAEEEPLQAVQIKREMPRGGVWRGETKTPIAEDATENGNIALFAGYNEDAFFDYLENACKNREEKISVQEFQIPADEMGTIYLRFVMTRPMALLRTEYNIEYGKTSGLAISLYPTYLLDSKEDDDTARILLQQKAEEYASAAKQYENPLEQILSVHDAIICDTVYDTNYQLTSYHAYGVASGGKAVCQGYSQMFYMVSDKLGIEVNFITYMAGDPSDPSDPNHAYNHMWNCVQLDGKWYFLDVTWDDPDGEDQALSLHNYFLVSEATMMERDTGGGHGDKAKWSSYRKDGSVPDCTDTTYETDYIFNFPNPITLVREGGKIGFYLTLNSGDYFFCSDSLYVGNVFVSRAEGNQVKYFFLNTPPAEVTLYMVYRNRSGVIGKIEKKALNDKLNDEKKIKIYTLSLDSAPAKYPSRALYFWEGDTLNPCGGRINIE